MGRGLWLYAAEPSTFLSPPGKLYLDNFGDFAETKPEDFWGKNVIFVSVTRGLMSPPPPKQRSIPHIPLLPRPAEGEDVCRIRYLTVCTSFKRYPLSPSSLSVASFGVGTCVRAGETRLIFHTRFRIGLHFQIIQIGINRK